MENTARLQRDVAYCVDLRHRGGGRRGEQVSPPPKKGEAMTIETLKRGFRRIGARLEIADLPWFGTPRINVRDGRFVVWFTGGKNEVGVEIVDARPRDRHLLLLVRDGAAKSKFVCGHDERHWFVAAVPEEARGVTGVADAVRALQPETVREAAPRKRRASPYSRRNNAYRRQGERFFVPVPEIRVDEMSVLRDEPISRGAGGTPHVVENVYRRGGETVYVSRSRPNGISQAAYDRLSPKERRDNWQVMVRDPEVFARGSVRHPDHATIVLNGWHRVVMNTEHRSHAMRHVAFLD